MKRTIKIPLIFSTILAGCQGTNSSDNSSLSSSTFSNVYSSSTLSTSSSSSSSSLSELPITSLPSAASSNSEQSSSLINQAVFAPENSQIGASVFCETTPLTGTPTNTFQFERTLLEEQLSGDGLIGNIHGITAINQQYVFTYRQPGNFFEFEHLSLAPSDTLIATTLAKLHRHDQVSIKGTLLMTGNQRHILVNEITVTNPYTYQYDYNHLVDESQFNNLDHVKVFGKVHALIGNGEGLAMEYQDMILPVIIDASYQEMIGKLFRNDILLLNLSIIREPNRPLHFQLDTSQSDPIQIIDSMVACHNQNATLQGKLIRFPESPQISREVFAVQVIDSNGIKRNYTLFPDVDFSQPNANTFFTELLDAISQKSRDAWEEKESSVSDGRNYFINKEINVTVSGRINVTSPNQANPQIYINDINTLIFN